MDLEREHVHEVYSKIAAHFSDTRFKPWPGIAQFLQQQPSGCLIADVGCGNGKYLGVNDKVFMLGSDICPELVSIGRVRGHEVMTCDCLHLPYRDNLFDAVLCIAVIHHLSSESRRLMALLELTRVLCPGGRMLVYVWAMEQERKKFSSQDVMVPWHLQPKYTPGGAVKSSSERNRPERQPARKKQGKSQKSGRKEEEEVVVVVRPSACADGTSSGNEGTCSSSDSEALKLSHTAGNAGTVPIPPTHQQLESDGVSHNTKNCPQKPVLADLGYTTYQRYYHVFRKGELAGLFQKVPELHVEEEFYDHENWCVLAVKCT